MMGRDYRGRTVVAAAILWVACGGKLLTIDIAESSQVVVPRGTLLDQLAGQIGFGEFFEMDLTSSEELANQGVEPGDIREVFFVDFVMTATDPPGADLSFLTAMDVFVSAPGLAEVRIASQTQFPEGVAEVAFDLDNVDMTDYVVSKSMTIRTDVSGALPPDDTTVRADFLLEVGVTAQGVCNQL